MRDIKLSDTEVLHVIHHVNNLDVVKHLAQKLQDAINNSRTEIPGTKTIGNQLAQRIEEQERELLDAEKDNKYLRESLKQIEQALVLPPGYTAAYLVEKVSIVAKSHDVLDKVEKHLTTSKTLYPDVNTGEQNQGRWQLASELLGIIKGKYVTVTVKSLHEINAETQLAQIRSIMFDSSLGGEVQRLKVLEVLKK
nr:MAG: hypothetical protein [Bacteriophage sp.]